MDYFKALQELLAIEREEDRKAYEEQTRSSSASQLRANGLSWYPIAIRGTELSRADYLTIEVERTTHTDVIHQFRSGVSVMLFSNHDPQTDRIEGTITYVGGNRMKISLRTDELPEWADNGKLGIDLLFDDNSYDEMQNALNQAINHNGKGDEGRLIAVLTGRQVPTFDEHMPVIPYTGLNSTQQAAVNRVLQANELAIVHGPPGTGKTTTLVQAIKALIKQGEKQILVVAPSNTAVDLLSEKLSDEGLNVLRVGNPARVSERLMSLTLDSKMTEHSTAKEIKRLRKQAAEYKDMAHKYKRHFGKAEREQRKALFDEAYKIMKDVSKLEQYITDDLIANAQIIAATPVGANHYTIRDKKYSTVVIDEAGQALEPACWIPLLKAKKAIFAGDHCQLPPTIKSDVAARKGLGNTLFEKCIQHHPAAVTLLEQQYRMHHTIMSYPSEVFYENRLKAHDSVAHHLLHAADTPLEFIDTAGCGYDEKDEDGGISNPEEAAFVIRHLAAFIADIASHYQPDNFPRIGVIAPYRAQVSVLKDLLEHAPALTAYARNITINTVDSFQGQERDVIYISMTRSNSEGVIGFLSDIRRMNVAMTRARKKLLIIGDSSTLSRLPFYEQLISYATQAEAYRSAWEYMDV